MKDRTLKPVDWSTASRLGDKARSDGAVPQISQGVTGKQLKRVSDWQMTEEVQRDALEALVHVHSRLDTTLWWGRSVIGQTG